MDQVQLRLLYSPKKENLKEWQTTSVDLSSYIDLQYTENVQKKEDGSQMPFLNKELYRGEVSSINTGTNTITVTGNPFTTNELRWHTYVDKNGNYFRIESNTANTITLSTDYTFPVAISNLSSGDAYKIKLPAFQRQDIIQVYLWIVDDGAFEEPSNLADKLAFNGSIKKWKYTENAETVIVTLNNLTEMLLKSTRPWYYPISGANKKAYEKIENIIQWVNTTNKGAIQINANFDPGGDDPNPTTKNDGTAFPDKDYYSDYRNAYDVIWELSQDEYTEDEGYYFYLKPTEDTGTPSFDFIWRKKTSAVDNTYTEIDDFKLKAYSLDESEVTSMLSIRCGKDAKGSRITTFLIGNLTNGGRGRPVTKNFAGDIITKEVTENSGSFNTDATDGSALFPTSYNYTTSTSVTSAEAAQYPDKLSLGTYTATSDSEYNTWVRWLAKARGKIWGQNYLRLSNKVIKHITVQFYNTPLSTIPGDLDKFDIPSIGFIGGSIGQKDIRPKLRLKSKKVSVDKEGLIIECEYEEDPELVVE